MDLARHFERRLPRYTSYPTAAQFGPDVDGETVADWLGDLDPSAVLSLYLHVPFCRQVCWYCACNMKLVRREGPLDDYTAALEREIAQTAERLPGRMRADHLHWGGGTPTALGIERMTRLTEALHSRFDISPEAEIAVELDPRTFAREMAEGLARMGVTRASLGVQEFDDRVQQAVNRVQPFGMVADVVAALRAAGIAAINFDLMYGLPHQSAESLIRTVDLAATLDPDRIALFGYAHVPWMAKNQRLMPENALPGVAERFEQAEAAAERLVEAGYVRIGLDHFALPGDPMTRALHAGRLKRNFQGYTVDPGDALIGFGATAISALPQGYAQNIAETGAWSRAVEAGLPPVARGVRLTDDDRQRRRLIERLMCDLAVDLPPGFARETEALRGLAAEGLVVLDGNRAMVPEAARPALRVVAAVFDAHLVPQSEGPRHAVAV